MLSRGGLGALSSAQSSAMTDLLPNLTDWHLKSLSRSLAMRPLLSNGLSLLSSAHSVLTVVFLQSSGEAIIGPQGVGPAVPVAQWLLTWVAYGKAVWHLSAAGWM